MTASQPIGWGCAPGSSREGQLGEKSNMCRFSAVVLLGLWAASPAFGGAESYFAELVKNFGSVPRGPTLSHPFRLTNNSDKPVHIASVRVSCGCVTAHAVQQTLLPGQSTAIQAYMDTRRFFGPKTVTIFVLFDQPQWEEIRLQVVANAREDLVTTPESFVFGTIKKGSNPTRTVTITLLGSSSYQVVGVNPDSHYIVPSFREIRRDGAETTYQIDAVVRPDLPVGKWYTDIWVRTSHPLAQRVRLPLNVEVEPSLSLSHSNIAWGDIKAGTESERKIVLKGVEPFKISKIEGGDAEVSVTSNSTEAKPVHILTLKVKPGKAGDFSRKLKVITDLKEDGTVELQTSAKVIQ